MISISSLFEIGPKTVGLLGPYIERQKQAGVNTARATTLKNAAYAKANAWDESKLEGRFLNAIGLPSGRQLAKQRWDQYKTIYKGK